MTESELNYKLTKRQRFWRTIALIIVGVLALLWAGSKDKVGVGDNRYCDQTVYADGTPAPCLTPRQEAGLDPIPTHINTTRIRSGR